MTEAWCKFRCESVTHFDGYIQIKLHAVYEPNLPEDQRFCKATPTGSMEARIDNPELRESFVPGRSYYLHLKEA